MACVMKATTRPLSKKRAAEGLLGRVHRARLYALSQAAGAARCSTHLPLWTMGLLRGLQGSQNLDLLHIRGLKNVRILSIFDHCKRSPYYLLYRQDTSHTHILLARSPAPYSPFRRRAHSPTAFSGPMAHPPPSPPRPPPSHIHAGWMVSATRTPTSSAPSQDYLFPLYL